MIPHYRRIGSAVVLLAVLVSGARTQFDPSRRMPDGSLRNIMHRPGQARLSSSEAWRTFQARHPGWLVLWNEATGTPHRAFGPPIRLDRFARITPRNIDAACAQFLDDQPDLLKIGMRDLRRLRATLVGSTWVVAYRQVFNGLDVLMSELEIRLTEDGRVMMFGGDLFSSVEIGTAPKMPSADALRSIAGTFPNISRRDSVSVEASTAVLPIKDGATISFREVYQVDVRFENPPAWHSILVDAHTGEIVWKRERSRSAVPSGRLAGIVAEPLPTSAPTQRWFADAYVEVDGVRVTTDTLGTFPIDGSDSVQIATGFEGPWIKIVREDSPNSRLTTMVAPGTEPAILWSDSNSHAAERSAFYFFNLMHRFYRTLDPSNDAIQVQLPAHVNVAGSCNAFYTGFRFDFYGGSGACTNAALCPSVVFHEYSHAYVDRTYVSLGAQGMLNETMSEGFADIGSSLMEDSPMIARGFRGVGTYERDLSRASRYPASLTFDTHRDGQIVAGVLWDLRQSTSLDLARRLWVASVKGAPDDLDLGVAAVEWFLDLLVADDDDGDLSTGTPHFDQIAAAFNGRGLGTGLLLSTAIVHTPIRDTEDTVQGYRAEFLLPALALLSPPDSLTLHYTVNGETGFHRVPMTLSDPRHVVATIPPQSAGSVVQYYASLYDPLSTMTVAFPSESPAEGLYAFTVGMRPVMTEAFEQVAYWFSDPPGGVYSTGARWKRGDPAQTFFRWRSGVPAQPSEDNTPAGRSCYYTFGTKTGSDAANDVDDGHTELWSPPLDLRQVRNPVLRFARWFRNTTSAPPLDPWLVQMTPDDGLTVIDLQTSTRSTIGWETVTILLPESVTSQAPVAFRIVASDVAPDGEVGAGLDDVTILGVGPDIRIRAPHTELEPTSILLAGDQLYRADLSTNSTSTLGSLTDPAILAIAINPRDSLLYGLGFESTTAEIFVISTVSNERFLFSQVPNASARAMAFSGDTLFLANNVAFMTFALQTEESRTWPSLWGITIRALASINGSDELYAAFTWDNHGEQLGRWNPRDNVLNVIAAQDPTKPILALATDGDRLFGLVSLSPDSSALVQWNTATGTRSILSIFRIRNLRGLVVPSNFAYGITGGVDRAEIPSDFALDQNYPNPFNPATQIGYRIKETGAVRLAVYDLLGREVAVLVDEAKQAGVHTARWDAAGVPSGVYFCKLEARNVKGETWRQTRKMVVLK